MEEPLTLLLRLRPPQSSGKQFWTESGGKTVIGDNGDKFNADNVYSTPSSNYEIFSSSVTKLVENACGGYNTAILAYGQSGAGKTHTLLGSVNEDGILTHMVRYLFNIIEEQQKTSGRTFLVQIQIMELYCERVRDLLTDNSASTEPQIFEKNDIPRVVNIHEISITSADQALELINLAQSRRAVASTDLNDQSSRSHAIIQLTVESSLTVAGNTNLRSRKSIMSIVDLAGSENAAANTGQRAKEGANINKSLFTLTKVINALTDKNPLHIPYRDSKLTRLLKPCIGGNSTTLIICCVDPQNKEESARTLKFSERLKLVKSHVTINEDEEGGQLNKYLDEIERLNKELTDMKQKVKEDEMQEKTKRLDELRAQIIGGSNNAKPTHIRAPRRQTICAPGMRAFSTSSLFTPPTKRVISFLPAPIDESPTKDKRESSGALSTVQSTRSSESGNLEQESPLAPDDLAELEDLRVLNFTHEMKIQELNSEIENLKIDAADNIGNLQTKIEFLIETNMKLQKDSDGYNIITEKFAKVDKDNELLRKKLETVNERCNQLEVELTIEKAVHGTSLEELKQENMKLIDRIGIGETMSISEREKLITRIDELFAQIAEYKSKIDEYEISLGDKKDEVDNYKTHIELLKHDLNEANELRELEKKEFSSKLHSWEQKAQQIQNDAATEQSKLAKEIETLKVQFSLPQDRLYMEKEEELQRSKAEISILQKDLANALSASERNRDEVHKEISAVVSTRMELDKERILQLEDQLSRAKQLNAKLQLEHDEIHIIDERRQEAEDKLKEASKIIDNLSVRIDQTRTEMEKYKEEEIRAINVELSRSQQALCAKNAALDHSTRKNQAQMMEIRELTTNRNTLEQELREVKCAQKTQEEGFKQQILFKNREHEMNSSRLLEKIASLEGKIAKMEDLIRSKNMENVKLQGDISMLRKELTQARQKEEALDNLVKAETHSLTEKNKELLDSLSCAQSQAREYYKNLEEMERDMKNKNNLLEKALLEVNNLKNISHGSSYNQEVERLKRENCRLSRELRDIQDEHLVNKENVIKNCRSGHDLEEVENKIEKLKAENNEVAEKLKRKNETLELGIMKYNNLLEDHNNLRKKYDSRKDIYNELLTKYISLKEKHKDC